MKLTSRNYLHGSNDADDNSGEQQSNQAAMQQGNKATATATATAMPSQRQQWLLRQMQQAIFHRPWKLNGSLQKVSRTPHVNRVVAPRGNITVQLQQQHQHRKPRSNISAQEQHPRPTASHLQCAAQV